MASLVALTITGAGLAGYADVIGGHLEEKRATSTSVEDAWTGHRADQVLVVRLTTESSQPIAPHTPRTNGWSLDGVHLDFAEKRISVPPIPPLPETVRLVLVTRDDTGRERYEAVSGSTPLEFAPGLDARGRSDGFIHATLRATATPEALVLSSAWTHACRFVVDPAPATLAPERFELPIAEGSTVTLRFTGETEPGFETPCREVRTTVENLGVWRLARDG